MVENVLKVSNLKVAYGGIKAVKGIDLEVNCRNFLIKHN